MEGICICGNKVVIRTSWTDLNPRRRFRTCQIYGNFSWVDPPMCDRAKKIIPRLIRRIKEVEAEAMMGRNRGRKRILWVMLFFSWVLIILLWVGDMENPNNGDNMKSEL